MKHILITLPALLLYLCTLSGFFSAECAEGLRIHNPELLASLMSEHPNISFILRNTILGSEAETIDLTGLSLSPSEAAEVLKALPTVRTADLSDMNGSNKEKLELVNAFPDKTLLLTLQIGTMKVRTDVEELDISNWQLNSTEEVEQLLPCFPNLKKVIMSDCGLCSAEIDALNNQYDNIRFVWNVTLGSMVLRTDAECFAPCKEGKRVNSGNLEDLKYCTDLVCIDLGHMDITNCEWAAYMPNLKYLILADTRVTDISPLAGHDKLVFLELFLAPIHDISPLESCTALEDLNLCYVDIYNPEVLAEMTWLKRLWWDGPNWTPKQVLNGKLPNTEIVWDSGSSTGGTWRLGQRYFEMRDIMGMPYMVG